MRARPLSRRIRSGAVAAGVLVLAAGATGEVAAQEGGAVAADAPSRSRTMGLEEVMRLAADRNPDVDAARGGLQEAEEQVSEAWGNLFPSVDFSASYTRNVSPQVSFLPANIFDPSAPEGEFTAVQFGADNSWQSNVVVEQTLFDPRVFVGVGAAGRYRELQEEVVRGAVQDVVTRVRVEYFDLLLAQEEVRLTENSVDRVRRSLAETRSLNRAGLASDYDVLRLEVELANLEPNLRRARNQVASARRALAVDLDLDDAADLRVEGSLAELSLRDPSANSEANREILSLAGARVSAAPDSAELVSAAESRRSDVRQAEARVELRRTELRVEQMDYLPQISLFGTYNVQAQQNGSPDFFGSGRSRATAKYVGVEVSIPVFTGLRRDAAADRRRAVLRQARAQSRLARTRARTEVLDLLDRVTEAEQRSRGQELAVEQARRGFEIALAEFREGVSGQLQLTDAEVALRQSEFNYAQAVYDYLVARARLDEAVGRVPLVDPPGI